MASVSVSTSNYFEKIIWVSQVRGVSSAERNVLRFLTDSSNADGYVEKLYSRNIANGCELQRAQVFNLLRSLEDKRLIIERTNRQGSNRVQISNGYRLDLRRNHPPQSATDPGAGNGKLILKLAADDLVVAESRRAELDTAFKHADAYYNSTRRVLSVWVESQRQASAFYNLRELLQIHRGEWSSRLTFPAPDAYEFLHPKGAYSTAPPRVRGRILAHKPLKTVGRTVGSAQFSPRTTTPTTTP